MESVVKEDLSFKSNSPYTAKTIVLSAGKTVSVEKQDQQCLASVSVKNRLVTTRNSTVVELQNLKLVPCKPIKEEAVLASAVATEKLEKNISECSGIDTSSEIVVKVESDELETSDESEVSDRRNKSEISGDNTFFKHENNGSNQNTLSSGTELTSSSRLGETNETDSDFVQIKPKLGQICSHPIGLKRTIYDAQFKQNKINYMCSECYFTTDSLTNIKLHMLQQHIESVKNVVDQVGKGQDSNTINRSNIQTESKKISSNDARNLHFQLNHNKFFETSQSLKLQKLKHTTKKKVVTKQQEKTEEDETEKLILSTEESNKNNIKFTPCNMHCCTECNFSCKTPERLVFHKRMHNMENSQKCEKCDKIFKNEDVLYQHDIHIHQKDKPFKCGQCDFVASRYSQLCSHREVHEPIFFRCTVCNKVIKRLMHLRKHMRLIHKMNPDKYHYPKIETTEVDRASCECIVCNEKISGKYNLKKHMETHNRTCPKCERKFSSASMLKAHINSHLDEGQKPFRCDYCEKSFTTAFILRQHTALHSTSSVDKKTDSLNTGGLDQLTCEFCSKSLPSAFHLRRHRYIHTRAKNHICQKCSARFSSLSRLLSHAASHSSDKPFSCKLCSSSFSRKKGLTRHMLRHTQINQYPCPVCGKTFIYKDALADHERSHSEKRPWCCDICGNTFKTSRDLKRHIGIHNEKRDFKCPICSKMFRNQDGLRQHMHTHDPADAKKERYLKKYQKQKERQQKKYAEAITKVEFNREKNMNQSTEDECDNVLLEMSSTEKDTYCNNNNLKGEMETMPPGSGQIGEFHIGPSEFSSIHDVGFQHKHHKMYVTYESSDSDDVDYLSQKDRQSRENITENNQHCNRNFYNEDDINKQRECDKRTNENAYTVVSLELNETSPLTVTSSTSQISGTDMSTESGINIKFNASPNNNFTISTEQLAAEQDYEPPILTNTITIKSAEDENTVKDSVNINNAVNKLKDTAINRNTGFKRKYMQDADIENTEHQCKKCSVKFKLSHTLLMHLIHVHGIDEDEADSFV